MKVKILLFAAVSFCFAMTATAQKKPAAKTTTLAKKFKVPKMTTMLGSYSDSLGLPSGEVEKIIGLPLRIVDVNKNVYTVSSYQFLYRKLVVSETEDGKAIPATSVSSQLFTASPLPAIWVSTVRDQVKKGEELFFFDVIVKDNLGHVMYAPNLKITVL